MIEWELLGVKRCQSQTIASASHMLTEIASKIACQLLAVIAIKRIDITVFLTILASAASSIFPNTVSNAIVNRLPWSLSGV
jgi:hypothetical protein